MRETFEQKVRRALAWHGKDFLHVLPAGFIPALSQRRLSNLPLDDGSSTGVADTIARWVEWLGPVEVCHAQLGMALLRAWVENPGRPRSEALYARNDRDQRGSNADHEAYWALDAWTVRERIETIVRVPVAMCVHVARAPDRELAIEIAQHNGTAPIPELTEAWIAEFDRLYTMATADRSGRVRAAWCAPCVFVHPEYQEPRLTHAQAAAQGLPLRAEDLERCALIADEAHRVPMRWTGFDPGTMTGTIKIGEKK